MIQMWNKRNLSILLGVLMISGLNLVAQPGDFPFVKLDTILTEARYEYRYFEANNFMGKPVNGYEKKEIWLSREAAMHLLEVESHLLKKGYGLIIFDGYRPQKAVDDFVAWTKVEGDTSMKQVYYPDVPKSDLISKGYIADKSGHSRGSTIDLSLYELSTGEKVDMGTPFDFFGLASHPRNREVSKQQRKNRRILRKAMKKHGFKPLKTEWWHFSLKNEPFPKTYFNLPIK